MASIPRRRVLQFGLLGGAALGALDLFHRATSTWQPPAPPEPLACLSAAEFTTLAAAAERIVPATDKFSVNGARVAQRVDALLANAEPHIAHDIRQLLRLFENDLANFVFTGRLGPFSRMSDDNKNATIASWRDSRLTVRRTGYVALRGLCASVAFADPALDAAVGYPGPPEIGPQGPSLAVKAASALGDLK